jgi:transcriptional regulator with XRE-family HTH domain
MDGKDRLAAFIRRDPRSQAQFAREAGCSEGHLSLVLKGKRGLSVPLAKRISQATGGEVPVRELVADKIERAEEAIEAAQ